MLCDNGGWPKAISLSNCTLYLLVWNYLKKYVLSFSRFADRETDSPTAAVSLTFTAKSFSFSLFLSLFFFFSFFQGRQKCGMTFLCVQTMKCSVRDGSLGQQHQPVVLPLCVCAHVRALCRCLFHLQPPAGGALHIITHMLWCHIHSVSQ